MTYALDTNIISYVVNGNAVLDKQLREVTRFGNTVVIPLMAFYEMRRGLVARNAAVKMQFFRVFCERVGIPELTVADMNEAAAIYADRKRKGLSIDDADLIIAAQCVTNGYTLVTNNEKHFADIEGLRCENWIK
jgi:predicted nucleic acid-binding protein